MSGMTDPILIVPVMGFFAAAASTQSVVSTAQAFGAPVVATEVPPVVPPVVSAVVVPVESFLSSLQAATNNELQASAASNLTAFRPFVMHSPLR
ncbi:MAG: hypothetical protein WCK21_09095, partial [Actinomycetota bacterium]